MSSQICFGTVRHRRLVGKTHQFHYPVCLFQLDLAELSDDFRPYWLISYEKFNWISFRHKNYLGRTHQHLLQQVKQTIKNHGGQVDQVMLLTNLAYFGYCFNPISVYFCHWQGELNYCIFEVTNTPWGKSHTYVLKPKKIASNQYTMTFSKQLHVSPFLTMDYVYQVQCDFQQSRIRVHIENHKDQQIHFDATLSLRCQPLSYSTVRRSLCQFPVMTWTVVWRIYWQALKLWLKKIPFIAYQESAHEHTKSKS
ncbi:DUF1365 domain-containing protein [Gammaproteobacteria bacterium]|nr:DUF1365 domain-containing protein [Gammaproteobacteria bacterium]